ncbi:MAG: RnfABCDGE type electron transport complex subunit D [Bacillota bacterium]
MKLVVSSSPHVVSPESVPFLMRQVVFALLPALAAAAYFFGPYAVFLVVVSTGTAVACEAVWQKITGRPVSVHDWSAVITGILLAYNLPPRAPWWLAVVGSAFAIIVAKQLFGGLGHNFINPALAGRAFLLASWPAAMTSWVTPFDARTTATPLPLLIPKGQELAGVAAPSYWDLFAGAVPGCLGETSALALLAGGLYLVWRRVIDWRIPAWYLGTAAVLGWILGGPRGLFGGDPLYHLLAGGLILGAFFMATDWVTTPVTRRGRVIFAVGCGILTVLIRVYGGYPEGVSYSILLMNLATPLIDRYTVPRQFGAPARPPRAPAARPPQTGHGHAHHAPAREGR